MCEHFFPVIKVDIQNESQMKLCSSRPHFKHRPTSFIGKDPEEITPAGFIHFHFIGIECVEKMRVSVACVRTKP